MLDEFLRETDTCESFNSNIIGLLFADPDTDISDFNLEEFCLEDIKNVNNDAYKIREAIHKEVSCGRLKVGKGDIIKKRGRLEDYKSIENVFLTRQETLSWFESKKLPCPEILKPINIEKVYDDSDKILLESLENSKELNNGDKDYIEYDRDFIEKLIKENNEYKAKWRRAFEYESEGLEMFYELIEKKYFDSDGKPIYDISRLSSKTEMRKEIITKSNELKNQAKKDNKYVFTFGERMFNDADSIITSGKRDPSYKENN